MSIYYDIEERITIENVSTVNKEFVELIACHISAVAERVLNGLGEIRKLSVETENSTFDLAEVSALAEWKKCVDAITASTSLKVVTDYTYVWDLDLAECDNVGPFLAMSFAAEQDDEFLSTVLYESYNYADCSEDGCGIYNAYGIKDGIKYCGKVPFKAVEAVPTGDWYTSETVQSVEGDIVDRDHFEEVTAACKRLDSHSLVGENGSNLNICGNHVEYYMNNAFIRNEEEARDFAEALAVVLRFNEIDSQEVSFWDSGRKNMLRLIVTASGTYRSELAAI